MLYAMTYVFDTWDWDIDGGSTESGLSTYWRLCLNLLITE
ncbi:hypothetical protein F383_25611 [Gossypium arboreum]|uniref:Uncharacterized protein n=1 Tax=Gossypium arboreum TaxID=29729 RepID=A0A0B0NY15_GOSAR|nr:hypothetical protein F383_25611 [Gossypium arboreum]